MFLEKDDVSLYYEVRGSGEPLILIHGVIVDADLYSKAAELLSRYYQVITYDRRGNSRSVYKGEPHFDMEGQAQAGIEVIPEPDAVTGQIRVDQILPGDIVFLSSPKKPGDTEIYEMAVCTDTGTLFMLSPARTTVRLRNFKSGDEICERIITIRRIFSAKVTN